jgi:hypothetical protein
MLRRLFSVLATLVALNSFASGQDCNGDGLPESQQVNVQGLTAQYFANRTWSGPPVAVRVDLSGAGGFDLSSSNWSLPAGVPQDLFSVRWTGSINFSTSGLFQFRVSSDDGYRLYLDGVLLGSSEGSTSQVVPASPLNVTAGAHYLRVELREDFGEQKMRLERKQSTSMTWNVIANSNFRAGADVDANGVLDLCQFGDCNGNFLPDTIDIVNTPSLDCNLNGVLDLCEAPSNDCDGNGIPESCEITGGGLAGFYFSTPDLSGPVTARRRDAMGPLGLDFNVTQEGVNDWQPSGVPTDNFSARWVGSLIVPASGQYDLQLRSDDVGEVAIDGVTLLGTNNGTVERGPIFLTAGAHVIVITFREFGGDQRIRLRWRESGQSSWQAIPGSAFMPRIDRNGDGINDVCQSGDCNSNQVPDGYELAEGLATDCDGDGTLDECEVAAGAADCNGNRIPDACEAAVPGLFGRYFVRLGSSSSADPYRPGSLLAVRRDRNVAFLNSEWMPSGVPGDDFITIWTGSITTGTESGVWTFRTDSDDGARLTIDGTTVIDGWLGNAGLRTGSISLQAGSTYDLKLEFHEGNGGQFCVLEWSPPSAGGSPVFSIVPMGSLRMATPDCNANGIPDDCDIASGSLPDPGFGIPEPCAASTACPSDLDSDGAITGADLGILLSQWGCTASCNSDVDSSGLVDGADLGIVLSAWGTCP